MWTNGVQRKPQTQSGSHRNCFESKWLRRGNVRRPARPLLPPNLFHPVSSGPTGPAQQFFGIVGLVWIILDQCWINLHHFGLLWMILDRFWIILDHVGSCWISLGFPQTYTSKSVWWFGSRWIMLDHSGSFWISLGFPQNHTSKIFWWLGWFWFIFGSVWFSLVRFGTFWYVVICWDVLRRFGTSTTNRICSFRRFKTFWTFWYVLVRFGLFWFILVYFGSSWIFHKSIRRNVFDGLNHFGLVWIVLDHVGSFHKSRRRRCLMVWVPLDHVGLCWMMFDHFVFFLDHFGSFLDHVGSRLDHFLVCVWCLFNCAENVESFFDNGGSLQIPRVWRVSNAVILFICIILHPYWFKCLRLPHA